MEQGDLTLLDHADCVGPHCPGRLCGSSLSGQIVWVLTVQADCVGPHCPGRFCHSVTYLDL